MVKRRTGVKKSPFDSCPELKSSALLLAIRLNCSPSALNTSESSPATSNCSREVHISSYSASQIRSSSCERASRSIALVAKTSNRAVAAALGAGSTRAAASKSRSTAPSACSSALAFPTKVSASRSAARFRASASPSSLPTLAPSFSSLSALSFTSDFCPTSTVSCSYPADIAPLSSMPLLWPVALNCHSCEHQAFAAFKVKNRNRSTWIYSEI
jgi:hypothetical protein